MDIPETLAFAGNEDAAVETLQSVQALVENFAALGIKYAVSVELRRTSANTQVLLTEHSLVVPDFREAAPSARSGSPEAPEWAVKKAEGVYRELASGARRKVQGFRSVVVRLIVAKELYAAFARLEEGKAFTQTFWDANSPTWAPSGAMVPRVMGMTWAEVVTALRDGSLSAI